jgi:hypothetical protein
VEGENGYYRRNQFVPAPKVKNWDELNELDAGAMQTGRATDSFGLMWIQVSC